MYPYILLVNRAHPMGKNDVPKNLVPADFPFDAPARDLKRKLQAKAAQAAKELFEDCAAQGLCLYGISGYRPYNRQKELYEASTDGTVAPPGTSEHQTGLALDVSCPSVGLQLTEAFADTPEGKWLKRSAPLYGFILRYPKGKEKITGYPWEPWHIRYVTKSLSLYLSLTGMTLEEYHML
ncbi:MAG: M15 family metallopeptidase [Blautia sp.]|jgi:D-alanyl-D-alanine carboxypeptidase